MVSAVNERLDTLVEFGKDSLVWTTTYVGSSLEGVGESNSILLVYIGVGYTIMRAIFAAREEIRKSREHKYKMKNFVHDMETLKKIQEQNEKLKGKI